MKTHTFRTLPILILVALTATGATLARDLTFEERVAAQEAIERVYYSHQIRATKPFEEAVPREVLEGKVRRYLQQTLALDAYWKTPVTDEMLQRELERMARGTRLPDRLRELFAALDQDPFLIKECLARATLVDRLTRNFYAFDPTLHSQARQRAEEIHQQLAVGELNSWSDHPDRSVVELVERDEEAIEPEALEREDGLLEEGRPGRRLLSPEEYRKERARWPNVPGHVAPLTEEREAFVIRVVLSDAPGESRVASYVVLKRSWDLWWESVKNDLLMEQVTAVASDGGSLPVAVRTPARLFDAAGTSTVVNSDALTADTLASTAENTWDNGILDDLPDPRSGHTAVWTGTLMVVWGGGLNTGGRYDPATDTWTATSTVGAPSAHSLPTAVWTGTLMVVWGGGLSTGGRYDPATDTWTPTSTVGAPSPRLFHSAVWTGTVMVVWGGLDNTGGRYNPATDTWTPTSTVGAPSARWFHTAVWTGTLMVVWGGGSLTTSGGSLNTGGRYDPAADTWTPTSTVGAPSARYSHTAIWTGTVMVVWGGYGVYPYYYLNTGGRYDPATNTWTPTSTMGAPSGRHSHTAVWTGSLMIVWGGSGGTYFNTGGRYDPAADIWTPTSTVGAPSGRRTHTAVWTGSLMVVWGGSGVVSFNTGGRYDPATNTWTATSPTAGGAPSARSYHTAVWTGSVMVIWGGYELVYSYYFNTGGRYDPATDSWTATSTVGAPSERAGHTAVWTGTVMVVWGGDVGGYFLPNTGGLYDPATDTWTATSTVGAPSGRAGHTAVWTGTVMVVWGGSTPLYPRRFNTGGRYDPATDSWTATSTVGTPSARSDHTAVWTGSVMVVWGGDQSSYPYYFNTGGSYDPATDTWTATSAEGAPPGRAGHTAVWTGTVMVVWGGRGGVYPYSCFNTGGRYNPATDSWTLTSTVGAPSARSDHTAVWTGTVMVVWGGYAGSYKYPITGGRYDPATDSWAEMSTVGAPSARSDHTAIWTENMMVVWGGGSPENYGGSLNTGGRYVVSTNTPPIADAGPDQTLECTGGGQATAVLDGSGSTDPDSTPGTSDDIVVFKWSEGQALLASGESVSVPFSLGAHLVTLAVTDKAGAGSTDDTLITVQDTTPPALLCPANFTAECQSAGQAEVLVPPTTASDSCYGIVPVTNDRTPGGADASGSYPLGSTTITFTATDGAGNTSSCETVVTVVDTTPPLISSSVSPGVLWPPNHRMVDVSASVVATDACSTPTLILASVLSSEPDDAFGEGDGTTTDDIQGAEIGTADFDFLLRAERDGTDEGRIYQVTYGAIDGSGNSANAVSFVLVPHDVGKGIEYQWNWNKRYRISP